MGEKVPVYISKELYERTKKFIETQGSFTNIEEFIEFILSEMISEKFTTPYTKDEEEKIKERLKALGYI